MDRPGRGSPTCARAVPLKQPEARRSYVKRRRLANPRVSAKSLADAPTPSQARNPQAASELISAKNGWRPTGGRRPAATVELGFSAGRAGADASGDRYGSSETGVERQFFHCFAVASKTLQASVGEHRPTVSRESQYFRVPTLRRESF
jgi:hypothetical protein